MDLGIVAQLKWGPKKPMKVHYMVDLLEYHPLKHSLVSHHTFIDIARHLDDVDFHLCSAGHNVRYHWNVQCTHGGKTVVLLRLTPHSQGRLWEIEVCKPEMWLHYKPAISPVNWPDVIHQFHFPMDQDGVGTNKQGRRERCYHVAPGCLDMLRSIIQHQSRNMDASVLNTMERFCGSIKGFIERRCGKDPAVCDLMGVLNNLPGYKQLITTDVIDDKDDRAEIVDGRRVQGIMWVAPWARDCLKAGTHREVDCSFKAVRPYVYYIPMAVIGNVGVACGLAVWPTEEATCFDLWEQAFEKAFGQSLEEVPVLSDMGTAIGKFCRDRKLKQFYCHRHLLESLGSNSIAAKLFRHLLGMLTNAEIDEYMTQFATDLIWFKRYKKIPPSAVDKILVDYIGASSIVDHGTHIECKITNPDARKVWTLEARLGVSTCTNHVEPFHGHLNFHHRPNTGLVTHVLSLKMMVIHNAREFPGKLQQKVQNKQSELAKKAGEAPHNDTGANGICDCAEYKRNALMYQTDGFCRHTVRQGFRVLHNADFEACTRAACPGAASDCPDQLDIIETTEIVVVKLRRGHSQQPAFIPTEEGLQFPVSEPVPGLIRSLSLLIELDEATTAAYLLRFCETTQQTTQTIKAKSASELAQMKACFLDWFATNPQI